MEILGISAARKRHDSVGVAVDRQLVIAAWREWQGEDTGDCPLPEAANTLVEDALEEMIELRTQLFDDWWLRNHYRYMRLRELDRRRARELARRFLAALCLGKVAL